MNGERRWAGGGGRGRGGACLVTLTRVSNVFSWSISMLTVNKISMHSEKHAVFRDDVV